MEKMETPADTRGESVKRYYEKHDGVARVLHLYRRGQNDRALEELIEFLNRSGRSLHLTFRYAGLVSVISDYGMPGNHCVIRSYRQLEALKKTVPEKHRPELADLIRIARNKKQHLLLADRQAGSGRLVRGIFHELNAWLYSGCAGKKQNLSCMVGDWRRFLQGQNHRRLDRFLFPEKGNDPGKRVLETVYRLSKNGLLQSFAPVKGEVSIYRATAHKPGRARPIESYGVSASPKLAMVKCLGELLERLATKWDRSAPYRVIPASKLKRNYFAQYFDGRAELPIGWVEGRHLLTGETVSIPAQCVYSDFARLHREPVICPFTGIGSGVAAGWEQEQIFLNALYELIERDALMTGFLNRIPPRRLDPSSFTDTALKRLVRRLGKTTELTVLDITNDTGVPTCLSFIADKGKATGAAGGVKADLSINKALQGSIEEAYLEWLLKKGKRPQGQKAVPAELRPVLTYDGYRPLIPAACSGFTGNENRVLSRHEEYAALLALFRSTGRDILYGDITPSWAGETEYRVYRVFCPSLQPLFFTRRDRWVNKKRLSESSGKQPGPAGRPTIAERQNGS